MTRFLIAALAVACLLTPVPASAHRQHGVKTCAHWFVFGRYRGVTCPPKHVLRANIRAVKGKK